VAVQITTTHDAAGAGNPRLIFSAESSRRLGDPDAEISPSEFPLVADLVTIGSSAGADLVLPGLDERHAEIRRDDADEYVYVHLGAGPASTVNGAPITESLLRTGDRLTMGDWTVSFSREEFADHGRPYGGRQGGEGGHQRSQPPRPGSARDEHAKWDDELGSPDS